MDVVDGRMGIERRPCTRLWAVGTGGLEEGLEGCQSRYSYSYSTEGRLLPRLKHAAAVLAARPFRYLL